MKKIILLGDSILKGILLGEDKRYHISNQIDWARLENLLDCKFIYGSKMGCTINRGKENLITLLTKEKDIYACIIEFGGNDADYVWEDISQVRSKNYNPKTSLESFKENLLEIINILKENKIKPIIMNLPPINAQRYFRWFTQNKGYTDKENIKYFLGDINIIYRRQELYNDELVEIANMENVEVVNVRKAFLSSGNFNNLLCEDGIHPNAKGQELIIGEFKKKFSNEQK